MTAITNGKTIRVDHAEIKTAAVTIRALTVDRRQVTLALFRQLLEEPVVERETGEFRGLPWGTVNYCPDKRECDRRTPYRGTHLHVVWQKDGELRRALETSPHEFDPHHEDVDTWLLLALDAGWRPTTEWGKFGNNPEYVRVQFVPGVVVPCTLPSDYDLLRGYRSLYDFEKPDSFVEYGRVRALAAKHIAALKDATTVGALEERIRADLRRQKEIHDKRCERWRELTELDQLFIAT